MIRALERLGNLKQELFDLEPLMRQVDEKVQEVKAKIAELPPLEEILGDRVITPALNVLPDIKEAVGNLVAHKLIYPRFPEEILRAEERLAAINRADILSETDPNPLREEVKKGFSIFLQKLTLENGLKTECLVVQSKRGSSTLDPIHITLFSGNLNSASITDDYFPFARSWLEWEKKGDPLPPLTITILSGRDVTADDQPFFPPLEITGDIHKEIMDQLADLYGPIDQVVAFSLGCGVAAKVMDAIAVEELDASPKSWWLHNGPSSLEKVSKNYLAGRALLWPAAKLTGWDVDTEQSLKSFCGRIKELNLSHAFTIGVSGLYGQGDHHFPEEASLCNSPEVQLLKNAGQIQHLVHLTLSHVESHHHAHHARPLDTIEAKHLIDPLTGDFVLFPLHTPSEQAPFIQPGEHLAFSIFRELLASKQK